MQIKHLIIFAVIGIVALLGFNVVNGNSHEKNRAGATSNVTSESATGPAVSDTDQATSGSDSIASKLLGDQPKAILDDATSKINQAQQTDQAQLAQVNSEAQ